MNYNILAYALYLPITFYITFVVGKICFQNGEIYLHRLMNEHPEHVKAINRLLLIGYYLMNLGYASIMLSNWPHLQALDQTLLMVLTRAGKIIFILGIMHYNNLLLTYYISKRINKQNNKPLKPLSL